MNKADKVFSDLKTAYMSSDVVSGEFYHQEKISLEYEEKDVKAGIKKFLKWDNSPAKFTLKKGKGNWIIKDI